jgi:hypothetical protein
MKKCLPALKIFTILSALILTAAMVNAQTRTASVNGNWNNTATWGGASVPDSDNDVVINNGITVTVTADADALSVTFRSASGTLSVSSGMTLTVATSITLENIVTGNTGATLAGAGTINCASVRVGGVVTTGFTTDRTIGLTSTVAALNISGDLTIRSEDETSNQHNATFTHSAGTVTVAGTVVIDAENDALGTGSGSSTYTMNNGAETGTLVVAGGTPFSTPGSGTVVFDANGTSSTVNYSGAAQMVRATTYRNLVFSGSGDKTLTGVTTISADLTLDGSATATTAAAMTVGDDLILNSTSILTTGNTLAVSGDLNIANGAELIVGGFNFSAAGITTIDGTLTSNSTSGTKTLDNIVINTTGAFNSTVDEDYSITGSLAVNGSGSLTSGAGTWTFSGNSTLSGTGVASITTVVFTSDYSNTGNYTFSNLTITGAAADFTNNGTITIVASLTGTGEFVQGAGDRLNFAGSSIGISTFTASGADNTVNYDGAAQTIRGVAYQNLTLSGSAAKTLGAATTVNDTLSMRGTASLALGAFALTYSATATLEYAGSAAQTTTDIEFKSTGGPRNLKINNTDGVTLHASRTVAGSLILTDGVLFTSGAATLNLADNATTSNASDNSFVDGPLSKTGNDAFVFPVGEDGAGLRIIGISAPGSLTSVFTAEFVRTNPQALSSTLGVGLSAISYCEYWTLANTGTASNASVTLSWAAGSNCGGSFYVGNTNTLRIARLNAGTWTNEGRLSTTGDLNSGTILSAAAVTSFGTSFALGTSNADNALPVMFNDVKAYEKNRGVQVEWTNLTERDLVNYIVERSANGVSFSTIDQQAPRSNNNDKEKYSSFDAAPLSGANFYRIKVLEISGKVIYSKVIRVEIGKTAGFTLYPNPVKGNQVSVSMSNRQGQYTIKVLNVSGQEIFSQRIAHQGGSLTQNVELPASVKPGVYNMVVSGEGYREAKMFVVQ